MLPEMGPRQAANILWAFAKCGLHPNAVVPGVATDLLSRVADNKEQANAQELGNSIWAVATMQGDKPFSSAMRKLMDALGCQVSLYIAEPDHRDSAKPQEVASVCWGFATLQCAPHHSLLDRLCAYLVVCVNHPSAKATAQPKEISIALWALHRLRYVPKLEHVTTLLTHMSRKNTQPNTQEMCNIVYAIAGFGMQSLKRDVQALALSVIQDNRSTIHGLCNVAWGLAVLDVLTLPVFNTILDNVRGKLHVDTVETERAHSCTKHYINYSHLWTETQQHTEPGKQHQQV